MDNAKDHKENVAFLSFDSNENGGGVQRVSCLLANGFKRIGIKPFLIYDKVGASPSTCYDGKIRYSGFVDNEKLIEFIGEHHIGIIINNCVVSSVYTGAEIKTVLNRCNCKLISIIHAKPDLNKVTPSIRSLSWTLKHSNSLLVKLSNLTKIAVFPIYKFLSNRKYLHWRKSIYDNSDRVVVLSRFYVDVLCNMLNVDDSKVVSIPNPLTYEYDCSENDIDNKIDEVLIVSRLEESAKGLSRVFKAWQIVEHENPDLDWMLTIVGSGEDQDYYHELCAKYQLKNVRFEGSQHPFEYYKRAKVFLMSSYHEGLPMTVLEAEQMGMAIVAFNNFESLRDLVIDEYNGFLVNDNVKRFAERITELMQSAQLCKQYGMASVENSKRFSSQNVLDMWMELFEVLKHHV